MRKKERTKEERETRKKSDQNKQKRPKRLAKQWMMVWGISQYKQGDGSFDSPFK